MHYLYEMENISCIRLEADQEQILRCREKMLVLDEGIQEISGVLNLAGNPVRMRILMLLLEEKRLCPCDLSDILGMTIPAVSQHLRKLKDRKVVQVEKEGTTIYYSMTTTYLALLSPVFDIIKQRSLTSI